MVCLSIVGLIRSFPICHRLLRFNDVVHSTTCSLVAPFDVGRSITRHPLYTYREYE